MRPALATVALVILLTLVPLALAGPPALGPDDALRLPALPITPLPPPPAPAFAIPAEPDALPECVGAPLASPAVAPPDTPSPPAAPDASTFVIPVAPPMPSPEDPAWKLGPNATWSWTNGSASWLRNATGWRYDEPDQAMGKDQSSWAYLSRAASWTVTDRTALFRTAQGTWRGVNGTWTFTAGNASWRYANGTWTLASVNSTWRSNATEWVLASADDVWRYADDGWTFANATTAWRYAQGEWSQGIDRASPFGITTWTEGGSCSYHGGWWSAARAAGWEQARAAAADASAANAAARPEIAATARAHGLFGTIVLDADRYQGAQVGAQVDTSAGRLTKLVGPLGLVSAIDLGVPLRGGAPGGPLMAFAGANVAVTLREASAPSVAVESTGAPINVTFAPGANATLEGRIVELQGSAGRARILLAGEGALAMRANGFTWTPASGGLVLLAPNASSSRFAPALVTKAIVNDELGADIAIAGDATGSLSSIQSYGADVDAHAANGTIAIAGSFAHARAILVRTDDATLGGASLANVSVLVDGVRASRTLAPEGALAANGSAVAYLGELDGRIETVVAVPAAGEHTIEIVGAAPAPPPPPPTPTSVPTPTPTAPVISPTPPTATPTPSAAAPRGPVIPAAPAGALVALVAMAALARRRA